MKTIINAYRLFKKQWSSNLIIAIFFALLCSVSVYLYNQYDQRTCCYSMFDNSAYNILYTNMPLDISGDSTAQYLELRNSLDIQAKGMDGYAGVSTVFETYVKNDGEKANEEIYYNMYMIDETTAKALKYRLKQGTWLSEADIVDGIPPCIIGGNGANGYKLGDVLNISFLKGTEIDGEYVIEETQSKVYYVAGIFNDKQQFFNRSLQATSSPQPLSYYCSSYSEDTDLYIWAEHDLTYSQVESTMDYVINSNPIIYFNKFLSRESMNKIVKEISDVNIFTHYDLMDEEKIQIAKDYELILPTLIIMAIVSIVGIYSMCLLNIFKNYNMFAVFHLCGCSKRNNVLIVAAYSLFFMVLTFILVGIIYCTFTYVITLQDPYISQYIYLNYKHIVGIVFLCLLTSFLSFITPFVLLKKMSIAKQLSIE